MDVGPLLHSCVHFKRQRTRGNPKKKPSIRTFKRKKGEKETENRYPKGGKAGGKSPRMKGKSTQRKILIGQVPIKQGSVIIQSESKPNEKNFQKFLKRANYHVVKRTKKGAIKRSNTKKISKGLKRPVGLVS